MGNINENLTKELLLWMEKTSASKTRVAEALQITRPTLNSRLKNSNWTEQEEEKLKELILKKTYSKPTIKKLDVVSTESNAYNEFS